MLLTVAPIVAAAVPCGAQRAIRTAPAAALPASFATSYPSGVESTIRVTVDASGSVVSATSEAPASLQSATIAWAKHLAFAPDAAGCTPAEVMLDNVDFYPASSGIVGRPMTDGGVDFANRTYVNGPGDCKTSTVHDGIAPGGGGEYEASVENVFAGRVSGQLVAVVILRCEYNGHGFDSQAQLFAIERGNARRIGMLGSGSMASSDSPLPPWPGAWIHVSFVDGQLYADVWDSVHKCDGTRDWLSTAYAIRNGKLVYAVATPHHRHGLAVYCGD
ncbi:MAG TPA: hypothetical protein VK760_05385 [Candidatus Acidoferrales bacterium]|jgi:hypothetical protein|nr:hypothetical protein [Candidatus Acidoferrales bacterium]